MPYRIRPCTRGWCSPSLNSGLDDDYHRIQSDYPSEPFGWVVTAWADMAETSPGSAPSHKIVTRWYDSLSECEMWIRRDAKAAVVKAGAAIPAMTPIELEALDPATSPSDRDDLLDALITQWYS